MLTKCSALNRKALVCSGMCWHGAKVQCRNLAVQDSIKYAAPCQTFMMWWKVTKRFPSSSFHQVCCFVTHGFAIGNIQDWRQNDTVLLMTTADCSTNCVWLRDTWSYCTPRSSYLDFGVGRQSGKSGHWESRGEGNMFIMLQDGKCAALFRCNKSSWWAQFHKKHFGQYYRSEISSNT